jgi:hypothetical protein
VTAAALARARPLSSRAHQVLATRSIHPGNRNRPFSLAARPLVALLATNVVIAGMLRPLAS